MYAAAALWLAAAGGARAQTTPANALAPSAPLPDALVSTELLASTITAIDHADKTGNYTVLLALGSARFRANNSAASLGAAFSVFRTRQIDLAEVLILSPTYEIVPTIVQPNLLRMRGSFQLTRGPVGFDFLFGWDNGWRLDGVLLTPPPVPLAATGAKPSPNPPRR
ncbi:hypothetical protein BH09PSE4_BH09PSE4_16520 [soil metagenome]